VIHIGGMYTIGITCLKDNNLGIMLDFVFKRSILTEFTAGMLILVIALIPVNISIRSSYAQGQIAINGAGATFPFPLIDSWRVEYQKVKPNVSINYQSIGSGGGVKQFTEKTVDFGASDAPLSKSEQRSAKGAVHIPETIGSVVVAYNIPNFSNKGLKLSGPVIADIFLGKITKWNDPKIQIMNPGVSLPSNNIVVVHRSDGSGTTFVWTDYLSKVSSEWNNKVGKSKSVPWPIGIGAPGNEGVANAIKGTQNTIGYIELAYALTTQMPYAYLQNQAGKFIEPSISSTKSAVSASAANLPKGDQSWESVSLVNAAGADSYPIASFSYLLLYKELSTNPSIDGTKAKALVDFISWAITDGQKFSDKLGYISLPDQVVKLDQETLKSLTFHGKSLT
jgi:phosphate transport system substrate-binding protein